MEQPRDGLCGMSCLSVSCGDSPELVRNCAIGHTQACISACRWLQLGLSARGEALVAVKMVMTEVVLLVSET